MTLSLYRFFLESRCFLVCVCVCVCVCGGGGGGGGGVVGKMPCLVNYYLNQKYFKKMIKLNITHH